MDTKKNLIDKQPAEAFELAVLTEMVGLLIIQNPRLGINSQVRASDIYLSTRHRAEKNVRERQK